MKHTKEPWENDVATGTGVFAIDNHGGAFVADCGGVGQKETRFDNAHRIVACVNACAGLPEPEKNIRELVEFVERIQGLLEEDFDEAARVLAPFEEKK